MGFEYGYSLASPETLVIWEAQFGDFANNAQVIIDQFITTAEVKWKRFSGLVLYLPHGYEGQGPEHSSARVERILQLCAEENIQVCYPSTSAQLFHLLRRQILRAYRKPLFILTPKSLLRMEEAGCTLEDLGYGAFREVLYDKTVKKPKEVRRILFVTGKIYYEILKEREKRKKTNQVALIRIEQHYPFPKEQIEKAISSFPNAEEFFFVQEEPYNMGFIAYMKEHLAPLLPSLKCIAREPSASPAEGLYTLHVQNQKKIIQQALEGI